MAQRGIRATFMRGGTSKGVVFNVRDLPAEGAERDSLFLRIMGSPDPYRRQLDGMGGGVSSLSKVCIVGPATHPEADVDYTFGQVLVSEAKVDYAGNCGNMSAAIGPFAIREGLSAAPLDGMATLVIHNTNTGKLIRSSFEMRGGEAVIQGKFEIDGVAGGGAPIRLDFLRPGGSKTGMLLPTKSACEVINVDGRSIEVSMVDAANPCVFVLAADVGVTGMEEPEAIDADPRVMALTEAVRRRASVAMGLSRDLDAAAGLGSVPKVAMVFSPRTHTLFSGRVLHEDEMDIGIRMISMEKTHRAVPITGAICLGAAMRIAGSIPSRVARPGSGTMRIAHPSGTTVVDAVISNDGAGNPVVDEGTVIRTARRLFEGVVFC